MINDLPEPYNGCTCVCHTQPGVSHFMACCGMDRKDNISFKENPPTILSLEVGKFYITNQGGIVKIESESSPAQMCALDDPNRIYYYHASNQIKYLKTGLVADPAITGFFMDLVEEIPETKGLLMSNDLDTTGNNCQCICHTHGFIEHKEPCCELVNEPSTKSVYQEISLPKEIPPHKSPADIFEEYRLWGENVFGPVTPSRITKRAQEEMDELHTKLAENDVWSPEALEEVADVVIILTRAPGLWDAITRKMDINYSREWNLQGDGTGYHVPKED